jgi:hypothetical protein
MTERVRIKMSVMGPSYHINPDHHVEAVHDWLPGTFVQGGDNGIVFTRNPEKPTYTTTFVEAFPGDANGGGFFRGEGSSVAEAENDAWTKYQRSLACDEHDWDARGYTNGGGFCKKCNRFGSDVFTGEQLGQFCVVCGKGTTYSQVEDLEDEAHWYCEEHSAAAKETLFEYLDGLAEANGRENLTEKQRMRHGQLMFLLDRYPDEDE